MSCLDVISAAGLGSLQLIKECLILSCENHWGTLNYFHLTHWTKFHSFHTFTYWIFSTSNIQSTVNLHILTNTSSSVYYVLSVCCFVHSTPTWILSPFVYYVHSTYTCTLFIIVIFLHILKTLYILHFTAYYISG